jgi:hypothetical protein
MAMIAPRRRSCRTSVALSAALLGLLIGATGASASPRTWHVAPSPLAGLPAGAQVRTIAEAAARVAPGDTVVIHGGIYREKVTVETSGTAALPIRFVAARGESVILSGADAIRSWRKEPGSNGVFSAPWPHLFIGWNRSGTHPEDDFHAMIGRCEQVFIVGYPLLQVLERSALARGTFHIDLDGKRIYVCPRDGSDLASEGASPVEASVRPILWEGRGQFIHVRGIRFRYAANHAQQGAAQFQGPHSLVENCVFECTNASGASFLAPDLVVRRCRFEENGQLGFGAAGAHRLLLSECVVRNNNLKGFNRGWEAGGDKIVLSRGVVIEQSQFVGNRGNGVWFDIGNEDCTVRNCLIADNEDAGIFYEISFGLHAHDNVILGNGFAETPGSWGAGAAISLSSSPNCLVERNLMIGNREGFNLREQERTTSRIDDRRELPIWNHDERVHNNVLALNRDAQSGGWFDVSDNRHWPAATRRVGGTRAPGMPPGLCLEKLAFQFDHNLYHAEPSQGLYRWGVDWREHKEYARLGDVKAELGLEAGSQSITLDLDAVIALDFRLPAASPAIRLGCYPRGEVPGVNLGIQPGR